MQSLIRNSRVTLPKNKKAENLEREKRVQNAIKALEDGDFSSARDAARAFDISHSTLSRRLKGRTAKCDWIPKSMKPTLGEEQAIADYVIDLGARGYPPRPIHIKHMANSLLAERGGEPVGQRWTSSFINRQPELKSVFCRRLDAQGALAEDPVKYNGWFKLVRDTVLRHGIADRDIYNFDETVFPVGLIGKTKVVVDARKPKRRRSLQSGNREWVTVVEAINSQGCSVSPLVIFKGPSYQTENFSSDIPRGWVFRLSADGWRNNEIELDWLKHFDEQTRGGTIGPKRLLILNDHTSHRSPKFLQYCADNNIETLCMPAHSSHKLQPLDVSCFGPLKQSYYHVMNELSGRGLHHATRTDFLGAFIKARESAFTERNIKSAFRATGLVPWNPQIVLSKLELPETSPFSPEEWTSQTPQNLRLIEHQAMLVRERLRDNSSSPSEMCREYDRFTRGALQVLETMEAMLDLAKAEILRLHELNLTLMRQERVQTRRVRCSGSPTALRILERAVERENASSSASIDPAEGVSGEELGGLSRLCGHCRQSGHDRRNCPIRAST